jgi:hypothetical protein
MPHTPHIYEVSATPCAEFETERTPLRDVAETLLHETAVSESGYGHLATAVAARNRKSQRWDAAPGSSLAHIERSGTVSRIMTPLFKPICRYCKHAIPLQADMSVLKACDTVAGIDSAQSYDAACAR